MSEQLELDTKPAPKKKAPVRKTPVAEKKAIDMSPFITSEDNVYAVTNIPEEYLAVLFAKVSRSPKPFREELERALSEDADVLLQQLPVFKGLTEKARAFHEKWTVGYGHSSVSELASVNLCLEKVSRLATEQFELGSRFISLTEFSQRYQKPVKCGWHNPAEDEELSARFEEYFTRLFSVYEQLVEKLTAHHVSKGVPKGPAEKVAYEDARYVLPLAMHSQLGAKVNGRALSETLQNMYASPDKEIRDIAQKIKHEASKVLPTLIRHVEPSPYLEQYHREVDYTTHHDTALVGPKAHFIRSASSARLTRDFEETRLLRNSPMTYKHADHKMKGGYNRQSSIEEFLKPIRSYDQLGQYGEFTTFRAEFFISEACWHQLLRHNRRTNFVASPPSAKLGVVTPPAIKEAGLVDLYQSATMLSNIFTSMLEQEAPHLTPYAVLNMHIRVVNAQFDLNQFFHLVNLRTSSEAQWEIRDVFNQLHRHFETEHPAFAPYIKRRT
ncbi:FAD-dependent thymidylate synthase [Rhodococcus sp. IEGM1300]